VLAAAAGGEHGEALVAVLEAVAIRTGVRAGPPHVGEACDIGDLVEHPCSQQKGPRQLGTAGARDPHGAVEHLPPWTSRVTTSTP
jgi:hypothetical protein